jgi:hypothetical protein
MNLKEEYLKNLYNEDNKQKPEAWLKKARMFYNVVLLIVEEYAKVKNGVNGEFGMTRIAALESLPVLVFQAMELYLKTLLVISGKNFDNTHVIPDLYNEVKKLYKFDESLEKEIVLMMGSFPRLEEVNMHHRILSYPEYQFPGVPVTSSKILLEKIDSFVIERIRKSNING